MQRAGVRVRIQLTGQVRVVSGDVELDESGLPGRQGRSVLVALALAGEPIHRDVLAEGLWPEGLPATWERTLSGVISRLRSAFVRAGFEGLAIANAFGCYELQMPAGAETDVRSASIDAIDGERRLAVGDLAGARTAAGRAVDVARRPLLAGEDAPWLVAQREELKGILVRALDVLAASSIGTTDAVGAATEALDADPFRESSHGLLMRAHAALGNTAEALLAYERCRELLADELGIDPSPETQAVHVDLLRAEADVDTRRLTDQGVVTLPTTTTTFVGRAVALDELLAFVTSERLITLTGPGGVGKTRLAVEAARRAIPSFPGGVRFADLSAVSSDVHVLDHLASALGLVAATTSSVDAIASAIEGSVTLLVVDNCEHVIGACATSVRELAGATTTLTVLATSRVPLGVPSERVIDVPVLDVPDEDDPFDRIASADAVVLFRERASAARPGFDLNAASASAIVAICRRLDGVPLAIELAASRAGSMSIAEIGERLRDRFDFVSDGSHEARHRTLRTAIDFSYDLLAGREAEVFRRLSVFEASFSAEDASAVCGDDVAEAVGSLASRSLLTTTIEIGEARYRMLETIKEYARERIGGSGEWEMVVDRHIARYAVLIPELDYMSDRAEAERLMSLAAPDAVTALERALDEHRVADAVDIAASIWGLWLARGPLSHGRALLERTLEAARGVGHEKWLDWVLDGLGTIAQNQGDLEGAERYFRDALELVTRTGDEKQRAVFLIQLAATIGSAPGREDEEALLTREGLEAAEASGSDFAAARAHTMLGFHAGGRGDAEDARVSFGRALELFTRLGHATGIIRSESMLAMVGWPDAAASDWRERLERAIALCREHGDALTEGMITLQLGYSLVETGVLEEGLGLIKDALDIALKHGSRRTALSCIEQIACATAEIGDAVQALTLFTATDAWRSRLSVVTSYPNIARLDAMRELARSRAGDLVDEATSAGRELSFDDACALGSAAAVRSSGSG